MWILPKNLQLTDPSTSLAFVADTVASKEDLTLLAPTIESSLMWRSKPTPLRTWLTRWKRVSWIPHLFTRILKPSQHISFETALTSSLEVTRANHLAQREGAREKKIPAIYGPTSENISTQLDLLNASLKTSKDTSRLDSPQSSAIWKKMVTDTTWSIFSASECLAPHQRKRIYILANANSDSLREQSRWGKREDGQGQALTGVDGQAQQLADTKGIGVQRLWPSGKQESPNSHGETQLPMRESERSTQTNWLLEPNVGRVVDGCADRVDRIRLLGNGVVPQTCSESMGGVECEVKKPEVA